MIQNLPVQEQSFTTQRSITKITQLTMNLKNFEKIIEPSLLNRGFRYYEDGYVLEVEQVAKGEFVASVRGSDSYAITIKLSDILEITSHSCDCPYDWGTVCKHEIAVLYHIKDKQLIDKPITENTFAKIKQDLDKLDKKALVDILVDLSKKSKVVKDYLKWELGQEY